MAASALPAPLPLPGGQQGAGGAENASAGHPGDALSMVLDSVQSPETRRHYGRSLLEFAQWRAAHPGPLSAASVDAWRNALVGQGLSASTVNQKLAAVRKLARLAAANGQLAPGQAAAVAATRNVRRLGNRAGNWLTQAQAQALIEAPPPATLKGLRDRAALGLLVGCGLRREEAAALTLEQIQQRDGRWVIPDLIGKHGHIRTVPVPAWVKVAVDNWTAAAQIGGGTILRGMNRHGRITHDSLTGQALHAMAAQYGRTIGVAIAPHDLRRTCAKLCRKHGGELEQIQLLLGHQSIQTTERYLGTKQDLSNAPNDHMGLRWRDNA